MTLGKGVIESFIHIKGYGFILGEGGVDIFVYLVNIFTKKDNTMRPVLYSGEVVEFSVVQTERGYDAREVSLPGGQAIPS